jgi:hypothetical protein
MVKVTLPKGSSSTETAKGVFWIEGPKYTNATKSQAAHVTFNNIPPEHQHGIYARFA